MLGHVGQHSHTPLPFSRLLPRSCARPALLYSFFSEELPPGVVRGVGDGGLARCGVIMSAHGSVGGHHVGLGIVIVMVLVFWLSGCFIQSMVKMQPTPLRNRLFSFFSRFAFFSNVNDICVYRRKQPGFKPRPATPCCIFHGLAPAEKKFGTGAGRS